MVVFNPISLTVPVYAYHRTRVFSKIYDQEFGSVRYNNPSIASFQNNPRARVISHCVPISETYRFFQNKDSPKIRKDMLAISFLSVFYDSLFDEDYNPASIEFVSKIIKREEANSKNDLEDLIALALSKLEAPGDSNNQRLYGCFGKMQELQVAGLDQRRERYENLPTYSREEYLRHITFDKGACAFLTYSFVANSNIDNERLIRDIEKIGSYLQLFDDMLDVYKDAQEGNATLITENLINEEEVERWAKNALALLDKRFFHSPTKPIVLQALRMLHKEGLRKVKRFRQGLPEATRGLHKIGLLVK